MNNKPSILDNYLNSPHDILFYINISLACNLYCKHCYISSKESPVLDINAFLKWFDLYRKLVGNKKIKFVFFGGEPLLHITKLLQIVERTKNENMFYDINTNLVCKLTEELHAIIEYNNINILTSWDPISIRFKTQENFELWKYNCKEIDRPKYFGITLLKEVLELDPRKLFEDILTWSSFDSIMSFQPLRSMLPLHSVAELVMPKVKWESTLNLGSIPTWEEVDDWLCKAYDVKIPELTVILFEEYINSCLSARQLCSDISDTTISFTGNKFSVFPDGTISSGYLAHPETFSTIYESPEKLKEFENLYVDKKYKSIVKNIRKKELFCRTCTLYQYCPDHRYPAIVTDACTFHKKLFKKIVKEYNPNILSQLGY